MATDKTDPAMDADVRRYERVGKFVYAFHRTGASLDQLRAVGGAAATPPDLARRATALVEDFDRVIKTIDADGDADTEAALREAGALTALIEEWQKDTSPT